jgi:hypothetical protein
MSRQVAVASMRVQSVRQAETQIGAAPVSMARPAGLALNYIGVLLLALSVLAQMSGPADRAQTASGSLRRLGLKLQRLVLCACEGIGAAYSRSMN